MTEIPIQSENWLKIKNDISHHLSQHECTNITEHECTSVNVSVY